MGVLVLAVCTCSFILGANGRFVPLRIITLGEVPEILGEEPLSQIFMDALDTTLRFRGVHGFSEPVRSMAALIRPYSMEYR